MVYWKCTKDHIVLDEKLRRIRLWLPITELSWTSIFPRAYQLEEWNHVIILLKSPRWTLAPIEINSRFKIGLMALMEQCLLISYEVLNSSLFFSKLVLILQSKSISQLKMCSRSIISKPLVKPTMLTMDWTLFTPISTKSTFVLMLPKTSLFQ